MCNYECDVLSVCDVPRSFLNSKCARNVIARNRGKNRAATQLSSYNIARILPLSCVDFRQRDLDRRLHRHSNSAAIQSNFALMK